MKLRTRLDAFSAALFSALGVTQLVACGGSTSNPGDPQGSAGNGSGSTSAGGTSAGGTSMGGTSAGGASVAGNGQSSATSAGAAGSVNTNSNKYPCQNPQDLGNGLVQCDGFKHRKQARTCASSVPRPDAVSAPQMMGACEYDADCKDKPYGWCFGGAQTGTTTCEYGCVKDSDCAANQVCDCGEPVGRCVQAQCVSDADCENGFLCKAYDVTGGCGSITYACQAAADTCGSDLDCASSFGAHCRKEGAPEFKCVPGTCAIGRPFLVEGAQRLAPVATRADWREQTLPPLCAELDATLSAQLAEQWTRIALMEHASIAAFARFSLQLMSLGAPASLIELATAAMVDETKHAKACFAVASRYAGAPLGPGRLDVERSLDQSSLQELVLNAIREGCVGEVLAAIEAREAAEHASEPALREFLLVISEDETRHAELAYRFVKWALAAGDPALERAVRREFDTLTAEAPPARGVPTDSRADLLRHGIVPEAIRRAIRAQAIAEVILPCSRALLPTGARSSRLQHEYV